MATQRGNLAYDFSVYEPKPKQQEAKQPQIRVKKNTNFQPQSAKGILLTAVVVLGMMFAMLYGKVETNRLFGETAKLQEYAQNTLGLKKLDKSQIEYVAFEGNTVIEVVEMEKKNIFVIIRNWFANIYEYLGA